MQPVFVSLKRRSGSWQPWQKPMAFPTRPCSKLLSVKQPASEVSVLILEYKLRVNKTQAAAIDEAIRTVQFIRNKCLRLWMDGRGIGDNDLQVSCSHPPKPSPLPAPGGSQPRHPSAAGAGLPLARF